jgi:two-component system, chemotaxis family, chemotaxis protein CheY
MFQARGGADRRRRQGGRTVKYETSLENRSFLIVDDEPFSRDIVRRMMAELKPRQLDTAESGEEALQLLMRGDAFYDCVITDFSMAPINGLELLKTIRTSTKRISRSLPVVMLTGHTDSDLVGTAIALDAHAFLAKPVSFKLLCDRLARVIADPGPVRPSIAYSVIPVPSSERPRAETREGAKSMALESDFAPSKPFTPATPAEPKRHEKQLDLSEVPPGSVLSRPFTTKTGTMLLGADAVLTPRMLNRLRDITDLDTVVDKVWVYLEQPS